MNFWPVSFEIQLLKMTFKPISITDRNVVRQAEFCVPNLADLVSLMCRLTVKYLSHFENNYVCIRMMHGSLICVSKFKFMLNRPAVVRYWEHWNPFLIVYLANLQFVSSSDILWTVWQIIIHFFIELRWTFGSPNMVRAVGQSVLCFLTGL